RTSVATASSENVCAATRTPAPWAASITATVAASSAHGARSCTCRSSQSATSLIQPLPALAWATAASTTSSAVTSSGMPRRRFFGGARWRPARASRGTSGSSSSGAYGYGEPASRIASTPESRSTSAIAFASSSEVTGEPPAPMPMWQWASTRPGSRKPRSTTVSAPGTGWVLTRPPTSHRSRTSSSGRTTPRTCSATPVPYGPPGRTVSRVLPVAALVPGELVEVQVGRGEAAVAADAGAQAGKAGEAGREARQRCAAGRARRTAGHAGRATAAGRAGPAALLALALVLRRLGGLAAADAGQAHHPAHLAHLLHHRLGLGEAVEQLVDLDDGAA